MKCLSVVSLIAIFTVCLSSGFGGELGQARQIKSDRQKTIAIEAAVNNPLADRNDGQPAAKVERDVAKREVEIVVEKTAAAPAALRAADVRKLVIEAPVKTVIANFGDDRKSSNTASPARKNRESNNPKVAAGKVAWHKSFAAACEAAKRSGKPVLLFQLMGNLDEQFC
jgi:hypothetical protein